MSPSPNMSSIARLRVLRYVNIHFPSVAWRSEGAKRIEKERKDGDWTCQRRAGKRSLHSRNASGESATVGERRSWLLLYPNPTQTASVMARRER